ncbi:T4 family baseplate hub assembly chaperone [Streptomyces sp. NPDC002758]
MANDLNTEGYTNPLSNPSASNAAIAALLNDAGAQVAKPEITLPAGGNFSLPGGYVLGSDYASARYDAEVRELTGADEEALTKARQSGIGKYVSTLLTAGTVSVGDEKTSAPLLSNLLLGDRDMLLLEIRRATYGDEITWDQYSCPWCGEEFRLTVTLDEIPIRRLEDPSARIFEVPLRKGRKAFVRLPVGSDQEALLAVVDRTTDSEQNTLLLSRVLISVVEADGSENAVTGNPDFARALGIMDRQSILDAIEKNQPGPQYNDVKFLHDSCGKEVPLYIKVGDLFQGL